MGRQIARNVKKNQHTHRYVQKVSIGLSRCSEIKSNFYKLGFRHQPATSEDYELFRFYERCVLAVDELAVPLPSSECVCLLIFPELIINKTILLNMRDLRYVMKLVKKN